MKAPICPNCGKSEWRHLCDGIPEPGSKAALLASADRVVKSGEAAIAAFKRLAPAARVVIPYNGTKLADPGTCPHCDRRRADDEAAREAAADRQRQSRQKRQAKAKP